MTAQTLTKNTVRDAWPPADPAVRRRLRDLPPSATLGARVLATDGPLTPGAIATMSLLSTRTVRYGLDRLEEADFLTAHPSLRDARKQVYDLKL